MKTKNAILLLIGFIPMNFCFGNTSSLKKDEPTVSKQSINKFNSKKQREGEWEFYWDEDTKQVSSKGKFRNGKQIGKWTYFSQNGNVERTELNRFLTRKIKTEQYYPNGRVEKKGKAMVVVDAEYINYYWVGKWKCYDEFGKYVKTEKYVKGELVE